MSFHPNDKSSVSAPVVTTDSLNEVLAQKIANAQAMRDKKKTELRSRKEQKKEIEELVTSEEKQASYLQEQVNAGLQEIVETLINACEGHKYMELTDAEKAALRSITPLQLSKDKKINELFSILRYFADLSIHSTFDKLHRDLRTLASQIEECGTEVRSKLFPWLKTQYNATEFLTLLQNLEIPEDEIPAAIKIYQNFLNPTKATKGEKLTLLKNILETKANLKIPKVTLDLEKAKNAQVIHPRLKLRHELFEENLGKLITLIDNPNGWQIAKVNALIDTAITMAERMEAICALLDRIQQLKNKLDQCKQNPPAEPVAALMTMQPVLKALSDSVLQCEMKEAEYAEHPHQSDLLWMKQVCEALQSEMVGLVKTYQAPGSASVLSESKTQTPEPGFQPRSQPEVEPEPRSEPGSQPEPEANKARSCCNFLLQLMASKAVRNMALVLIVAGAIGIVVGGLALGGVGGVAAALGMSILAAKITTATSIACFALGTATFFGHWKAKGKIPSKPVLSDNQLREQVIASL